MFYVMHILFCIFMIATIFASFEDKGYATLAFFVIFIALEGNILSTHSRLKELEKRFNDRWHG